MLQLGDRFRRPHMLLAARAILVLAAGVERLAKNRVVSECELMQAIRFLGDFEQSYALDIARGAGEIFLDERRIQAHRLEDLRAAIRLVGRDAHLRHHLVQALADRLDVALRGFLG